MKPRVFGIRPSLRMGRSLVPALLFAIHLSVFAGSPARADEVSCAGLKSQPVPVTAISLPVSAVKIASATYVADAVGTNAFCKVIGEMAPMDPTSWPILFEVNLPTKWNGKAIQYGGGGTNGVLINGLERLRDAPPGTLTPVEQGYVTFGTDAGHPVLKPDSQAFAVNDEAVTNQAYASYKKVHDLAVHLTKTYYGQAVRRMYFFGASEGGRESLLAVQRYPSDYDGAVAIVPAFTWTAQHLGHYREWELQQDGGWVNRAKLVTLHKAVLAACDGLDGLVDGILSQYESCGAKFSPSALRCQGGSDTGDNCLSDRQVAFLQGVYGRKIFAFPLANGFDSYPGSPYGGAEADRDGMIGAVLAPNRPVPGDLGRPLYGPGSIRFFFTQDPAFTGHFDETKYRDRLLRLSAMFDTTNVDMSSFAKRGGKLLIKENGADYLRSPGATYDWYREVIRKMGRPAVEAFMRLYVNPGVGHGGTGPMADGSAAPNSTDLLTALDNWVERGAAPGNLASARFSQTAPFVRELDRPLCQYPTYPHYDGRGDTKNAANFSCRRVAGP